MDTLANGLVTRGLRFNTHRTYAAGQRLYMYFCNYYSLTPLPASEEQLLRFIAFMHVKDLSHNTIHVYLSSVSSMHSLNGHQAPPVGAYRVRLACKALKDSASSSSKKAPITYTLLQYIISTFANKDLCTLWTAISTLAFFGAMRGSEYLATVSPQGTIKAPLVQDVQFLVCNQQLGLQFTINTSKTSSKPIHKYIGCTGTSVCAVCALSVYCQQRASNGTLHPNSYLFIYPSGQPVTKDQYNRIIKAAVSSLSLPSELYSTHSLRAGAATTAAQLGFTEPEIKSLGHWASTAYTSYIHHIPQDRLTYAKRLSQHCS